MAYDIRLIKIVSGELVMGKFDAETDNLNEVAIIQTVPSQQGVQMLMLPYGYPFENAFKGSISSKHFLYQYTDVPQDVQDKYLEGCTNLTLSSGGLDPKGGKSGLIL